MGYAGLQPDDPREIGPYRLLGQLGTGGMGQVFLGMSAGGRPIAVKVIRTELAADPDFRARFRGEVTAAQKVSGLFTALVVDADLDCPMPWLATAYVAGPSLAEAVRGHGPLPVRSLMALAAGLAESLGAIHEAGVVHRDLKPSNVLLAEDGPRVIDFGISEAAEASVAAGANVMIGSPGYMSPEQVIGADIGPASDMFSLGAVLTFAATGQGPFGTGSHAALMYRLVNIPADLVDVPDELRSLVGRCLAKHPGDRPTAREMLAEMGAMQPAPGWLAESVVGSLAEDRPADAAPGPSDVSEPVPLTEISGQPPHTGQPPRGGTSRPGRHRVSRTVASAVLTGGLVAGSAVAALALIGANRAPSAGHQHPQAGAGAVATLPGSASNPSASPGASSSAPASASPSSPAAVSPNAFFSPAQSMFTGTSVPPTPIVTPSSGQPGGSSSTGQPPASSPPASSHPASSPPASSPPASSPPASSPPASSPPASSPPASSPPPSSAPASSPPASSHPPSSPPPASSPAASSPAASSPGTTSPSASST